MEKSNREEIIPTVSYSLAAIVQKKKKKEKNKIFYEYINILLY